MSTLQAMTLAALLGLSGAWVLQEEGRLATGGPALTVEGNFNYIPRTRDMVMVAGGLAGMREVDVSDPTSPVENGVGGAGVNDVHFTGVHGWLCTGATARPLTLTTNPFGLGPEVQWPCSRIAKENTGPGSVRVYIAGDNGLMVVEGKSFPSPIVLGSLPTAAPLTDLVLIGSGSAVGSTANTLTLYDVSVNTPVPKGSYTGAGSVLAAYRSQVYAAAPGGVAVVAAGPPPSLVRTLPLPAGGTAVKALAVLPLRSTDTRGDHLVLGGVEGVGVVVWDAAGAVLATHPLQHTTGVSFTSSMKRDALLSQTVRIVASSAAGDVVVLHLADAVPCGAGPGARVEVVGQGPWVVGGLTVLSVPSFLRGGDAFDVPHSPFPSAPLRLECCQPECHFFVSVLHCSTCRQMMGSLPLALIAAGFEPAAPCGPVIEDSHGAHHRTSVFHAAAVQGDVLQLPSLAAPASYATLFETSSLPSPWCSRPTGPHLPLPVFPSAPQCGCPSP